MSAPPIPIEKQVQFLKHVALFKGLGDGMIAVLASVMQMRKQKSGTLICEEGGPGNACFILASGQAEVFTGKAPSEQMICTLNYTSIVGEVALIDGKRRSASVRCKGDVTYFVLMRDEFERMVNGGNQAGLRLLDNLTRMLASRVRSVNQKYADISSQSGETIAKLNEKMKALQATVEGEGEAAEDGEDLMKMIGYKDGRTT